MTVVLDSFAKADSPIEPEEYIETPKAKRATTIASPNPGNSTAISRKELTARGAHVVTIVSGYVAVADAPAEPKGDVSRARSHRDAIESPREHDARRVRRKGGGSSFDYGGYASDIEGRNLPRARASPSRAYLENSRRATSRSKRLSAREFDEDRGLGRTVAVPHDVPPMPIASPHRARLASDDSPTTRRMAGLRL